MSKCRKYACCRAFPVTRLVILTLLAVAAFLSGPFPALDSLVGLKARAGQTLRCAACGRKIKGKYIKYKGKAYCSRKCLDSILPKCAICGKPATITTPDGKHYCSKKCLSKTWPVCVACGRRAPKGVRRGWERKFICAKCAKKPKCFACGMPASVRLADGRVLCAKCANVAVMKSEKAAEIAEAVRKLMLDKLSLSTKHEILYHLVSQPELDKDMKKHAGREMGLFCCAFKIEKTTVKRVLGGVEISSRTRSEVKERHFDIFFLYGTPVWKLREVAGHELGHDWMEGHYPHIRDPKLKEGWAEFVASRINILYKQDKLNKRLEMNPDPVYGDGYRYVKKMFDHGGMKALFAIFEAANAEGKKAELKETQDAGKKPAKEGK